MIFPVKIIKTLYESFLKFCAPTMWETRNTAAPITFKILLFQKILGFNRSAYWPMHFTSKVTNPRNITIGIGTAPGLSPGCYIQGIGKISIDDYTIIAPNVGIISANHDINDYRKHNCADVRIGKYCWIGMNSTIMPGVTLGDHVVVAANSCVTKSFPNGFCVIGGVPARILNTINPDNVVAYQNEFKYYGYINEKKIKSIGKRYLQ